MLTARVCLWCLVLVALLLMNMASVVLPSPPAYPHLFQASSPVPRFLTRHVATFQTEARPTVPKRPRRSFGTFQGMMQRHARYVGEQAFVDRMFRLFDMNSDDLIERDEFRAIMQLLGLIS